MIEQFIVYAIAALTWGFCICVCLLLYFVSREFDFMDNLFTKKDGRIEKITTVVCIICAVGIIVIEIFR
jgi:hypothetical protein